MGPAIDIFLWGFQNVVLHVSWFLSEADTLTWAHMCKSSGNTGVHACLDPREAEVWQASRKCQKLGISDTGVIHGHALLCLKM